MKPERGVMRREEVSVEAAFAMSDVGERAMLIGRVTSRVCGAANAGAKSPIGL